MRISVGQRRQGLIKATPEGPPPGERLKGHTDRSGTTIHGWPAVLFGLPFAGVGVAIAVLSALGKMRTSGDAPPWLGAMMGGMFAMAGLILILHGLRGIVQRSRTARARKTSPGEPWMWDHAWNPMGAEDDSRRQLRRTLQTSIGIAVFLVPFNWVSYVASDAPAAFKLITGIFDLVVIGLFVRAGYLVARRRKYGVSMLRFRRFPFVPGEEVELLLPRLGPIASLDRLEATLRCVQERYEVERSGRNSRSKVVSYAVWSGTQPSEEGDGRRSTEREFTWRFTIPAELPGTTLSERPPRYWELEVFAEMPGVDYRKVFLVPVYHDGRERRARLAG